MLLGGVTTGGDDRYVVDIADNRQRFLAGAPEHEIFFATLIPMTGAEMNRARAKGAVLSQRRRTINYLDEASRIRRLIFKEKVPVISGAEMPDKNTGAILSPKTGAELQAVCEEHLSTAVCDEVLGDIEDAVNDSSVLDPGLESKLRPQRELRLRQAQTSTSGAVGSADEKTERETAETKNNGSRREAAT